MPASRTCVRWPALATMVCASLSVGAAPAMSGGVGAGGPATSSSPPMQAPAVAGALAPPVATIAWRVENPFRFFTEPGDTEVHRATYLSLTDDEKSTPILSSERALSARHPDGWSVTMFLDTCWDRKTNRFKCPGNVPYINPQSHRVIVSAKGLEEGSAVECTWLTAPRGDNAGRGTVLKQDCRTSASFDVPYPGGMDVSLEIGGVEVARTGVKVRDILIVGMGDSFGSGEGNPDVPVRFSRERAADYGKASKAFDLTGYPTRVGDWKQIGDKAFITENAQWLDQACHRSLYSQHARTALQLAVENPHRAVTFASFACSGAEVTWGLFLRYKGNEWVPNPPDLSQISGISEMQCGEHEALSQDLPEAYHIKGAIPELQGGLVLKKCASEDARKIDLLLMSVGGNDIGFARLIANAVLADDSLLKRLGGWFGQIHENREANALLDRLDERYKALNRALHGILHIPWNESDRIVLTAYPPLALLGDGRGVCPDGNAGMEVYGDFSLSEARAKEGTWLADKLQRVMSASAKTHGWSFAEAHRKLFVGRGICAGFTDNAFSVADDLRLPRLKAGAWVPYNPADFQAYASRQRWFRTPNDAFLTGNFHVAGSVLQKALKLQTLSWFQILLASTYSGAFHPTAEGHAAMADAAADRARNVLKKYGQQDSASLQ